MQILTEKEFLSRVPNDDVYLAQIEKHEGKPHIHILAYSDVINECPGYEEPTFLYIPADTTETDLWQAIDFKLDTVKLYGGAYEENESLEKQYREQFLGDGRNILHVENTKEAMSVLKFMATILEVNSHIQESAVIVITCPGGD